MDTRRLNSKKQTLNEAYAEPDDILEIEITNAETHGFGKQRYTDYQVKTTVGTTGVLCMVDTISGLPAFLD